MMQTLVEIWASRVFQDTMRSRMGATLLICGFIALALGQAALIAGPLILEHLVNIAAAENHRIANLTVLVLAYGVSLWLSRAFSDVSDYSLLRLINDIEQKSRELSLTAILRESLPGKASGDLFAIWNRGNEAISSIGNAVLILLIPKIITIIIIYTIVYHKHGLFVLLAGIIGCVVYMIWLAFIFRKISIVVKNGNESEEWVTSEVFDLINNLKALRIYGFGEKLCRPAVRASRTDISNATHLVKWQSIWSSGNALIIASTMIVMMSISIHQYQDIVVAAGALVALSYFIILMFAPIDAISDGVRSVIVDVLRAADLVGLLNKRRTSSSRAEGHPSPDRRWAHLKFNDIEIKREDRETLFEPLTAMIRRGERVAIVAPSGTGKSTLAEALFFGSESMGGEILFGRSNGSVAKVDNLAQQASYLPQENLLLKQTIRDNVTLCRFDAEPDLDPLLDDLRFDDELKRRVTSANMAGSGGEDLSGGERRRVSLARVLLGRPTLLLLDEPFSGLDKEAAEHLLRYLMAVPGDTTMIFFLHEAPAYVDFDQVIKLEPSTFLRRSADIATAC